MFVIACGEDEPECGTDLTCGEFCDVGGMSYGSPEGASNVTRREAECLVETCGCDPLEGGY